MNNNLEPVLEKTGRMLSRKYGISVICRGTDCCTDGNTIYLPSLPDEIPHELFQAIRGYIDHECSHILGESDFKGIKGFINKYNSAAFAIYNALEDARVERVMQEIYPGSTENLSHAYHYALKHAPVNAPLIWQVGAILYATAAGREINTGSAAFVFSTEALQIAGLCKTEAGKAAGCNSGKEIETLAIRCWKKISKYFPPNESGNKTEAVNSVNKSGELTIIGKAAQNAENTQAGSVTSAADSVDNMNANSSNADITMPSGILGNLGKIISSVISEYAVSNFRYRAYTTEYDCVVHAEKADRSMTEILRKTIRLNTSAITQRFLQILQSRKYARWLGEQEKGKLNPRSLHRICTDTGTNVFRQRVKSRRINTAISLLLDLSGSMQEKKLSLALQTAAIFSMSLEKLNISTSITGFTTNDIPNDLYQIYNDLKTNARDSIQGMRFTPLQFTVFKDFHERFDLARLASARRSNLTPLGDALMHAARNLRTRKEERKIIFCLTDGRPCVGLLDESISFTHTRDTVQRIQNAGIEVVLIGIREDSVSHLSERHLIVNNLAELPKRCMQELNNLLA